MRGLAKNRPSEAPVFEGGRQAKLGVLDKELQVGRVCRSRHR
jgi:hypothetical protein